MSFQFKQTRQRVEKGLLFLLYSYIRSVRQKKENLSWCKNPSTPIWDRGRLGRWCQHGFCEWGQRLARSGMSSSGHHGTVGAGGKEVSFSGKRQTIASLSIALASYREKAGEFQIFLCVVKFSIQLPLRVPLRAWSFTAWILYCNTE